MDELKSEIIVEGPDNPKKGKDLSLDMKVTTKMETGIKPGVRTSEFWGTMLVHVLSLIILAVGLYKGSDGLVQFSAILSGLTQGTYNVGRGFEKGGAAKAIGTLLATQKDEPK